MNLQYQENNKKLKFYEDNIKLINEENARLKTEVFTKNEILREKDRLITSMQNELKIKDETYQAKINEIQLKFDEKATLTKDLIEKLEKIEKEMIEMV